MAQKKSKQKDTRASSGVILHASTVALAPARALTSHLRHRYRTRYHEKYRFSRVLFAFDFFLLSLLLILVVVDCVWLFQSSFIFSSGLNVTISTPEIRASDRIPMQVDVRTSDGRQHDDVTLRWNVPEWVEILKADPPMQPNGTILIGTIRPGETYTSHLLVRARAMQNTALPITVTLHQFDPLGLNAYITGSDSRTVASSALTAHALLDITKIVSGGSLPILIRNQGSVAIPVVTMQLTQRDGAPNATLEGHDSMQLSSLGAGESRIVFADIGATTASSVHLAWELHDGAQRVDREQWNGFVVPELDLLPSPDMLISDIKQTHQLQFHFQTYDHAGQFLVVHPLLSPDTDGSPSRIFGIDELFVSPVVLSLQRQAPSSMQDTHWSVLPINQLENGESVAGRRSIGLVQHDIAFSSEVRYYTKGGDQIGIGPLPPRPNEATSYWAVWTVGPANADFSDVTLNGVLAPNVTASGKYASSVPGSFRVDGSHVTWNIPRLSLVGTDTRTFAFEIQYLPDGVAVGKITPLILSSDVQATDVQSGQRVSGKSGEQTTDLTGDAKAMGKGVVQPALQ